MRHYYDTLLPPGADDVELQGNAKDVCNKNPIHCLETMNRIRLAQFSVGKGYFSSSMDTPSISVNV